MPCVDLQSVIVTVRYDVRSFGLIGSPCWAYDGEIRLGSQLPSGIFRSHFPRIIQVFAWRKDRYTVGFDMRRLIRNFQILTGKVNQKGKLIG